MLRIVEHWPWIASLALASTASAQRAGIEGDSIPAYDERSTLVVRVVDESGPVVRTELEVSVGTSWRTKAVALTDNRHLGPSGGHRGWSGQLFTDENGILRAPLVDPDQVKNPTRRLSVSDFGPMELEVVHLRVTTDDSSAGRTLAAPLPPGELELGDLALQPMTVVAAGRVIDAEGRPVSGARIVARNTETFLRLRATSDESGAFVLLSTDPVPEDVEMFAMIGERLSELQQTMAGSRDVSLVVSREFAGLTGSVLLDSGVPSDRVNILLRDARWNGYQLLEDRIDFDCRPTADGSFALHRMLPGTYVLRVHADRVELASLSVGTLRAGKVHTLDPIDL